ncbi:MAG: DNA topoisomerase (ATP-hydrolyzing) subunit B [Chloroflexota bacterium]|nr:DNA topoisomerase (ATP-hydrolyzing) subunit B [Chloroflexota bacterium]
MVKRKEQALNGIEQYGAADVQVLEGLEAVRRRPGMYVGGTDVRALHHLVYEVVDNAVDEALAGSCDRIEITIHADSSVTVADNGRGIPTAPHPEKKISTLELVMTVLHSGAKFGGGGYKVSGGLHGVGVSAVNALSEWLEIVVDDPRDGRRHKQRYERGIPVSPVEEIGKAKGQGTRVTFRFDDTIFKDVSFRFKTLEQRMREMAFITRGVTIRLVDEREKPFPKRMTFYFEGGIESFVRYLNRNRDVLHDVIYVEQKQDSLGVEVALQYTDAYSESVYPFANTIHTVDGGTHLTGLRAGLTRTVNDYARKANLLKDKDSNFSGDDVREGLTAIVSIKHPDPQFESQTKVKLMNAEVKAAVESAVATAMGEFLERNSRAGRRIVKKCLTSSRARAAARKARDLVIRKSALESLTLPGKLADCSERDSNKTEVFIVEGDSAGGCFHGDTQVALADGRSLSFKEIVAEQSMGKEHFCYTIRRDGQVGLERILDARMTRASAKVVRVTLDTGETVTCTPDHLFMLRDGSYKPANSLTPEDSLMPLCRKLSDTEEPRITIDGYEMVWDPRSDTWLFTHLLADWYNRWRSVYTKTDGDHCHHVDFNKHNNNPTNIQRLPSDEHLSLHREHVSRTLHTPEVIEKCREIRQSEEFRARMSERMLQPEMRQLLSDRAKTQWEDEEYKAYMAEKWRAFYDENDDYRRENRQRLHQAQREYWSDEDNRQAQAERVRQYFADHPEARETLSERAKQQWQDEDLLEWRREKTRQQWTPEFRAKRRAALHRTYYTKTIAALKQFQTEQDELDIDAYRVYRVSTRDKTLLRFDTFCQRYFDGNVIQAREAIVNYNHRVVSIEQLDECVDVYDIQVPGTHNFALTNGVFVHNSAKQGRDRHFQAILPLRGKILNTERARLNKILNNKEVQALISALGIGIGDQFDMENLRYNRVILLMDADVDGAHIRTLLLTFFFRYMQPLIEKGHLFIAQPPLYRISAGKQSRYVYTEAGREKALKELKGKKVSLQRYKGLGEMNPEQLWETTMNPEQRTLLQVTIEDTAAADRTFDMLMGKRVPPRRRFIQTHAKEVRNLDV